MRLIKWRQTEICRKLIKSIAKIGWREIQPAVFISFWKHTSLLNTTFLSARTGPILVQDENERNLHETLVEDATALNLKNPMKISHFLDLEEAESYNYMLLTDDELLEAANGVLRAKKKKIKKCSQMTNISLLRIK